MARRGRKPTGANLVDRLAGSPHAKIRLKVIVETLASQCTIPEACARLGIHESMFHKLRAEVLQTALSRLEPRPIGRPPLSSTVEDQRLRELEAEKQRLKLELRAAEVRRELAENLPRLSRPASGPGKKTTRPSRKRSKTRTRRPNQAP